MGIYIKGIEMPEDGNETIIRIQPDGTVLDQYGHHLAITAVPVPPHGRLIDEKEVLTGGGYIIADGIACIPVKYIVNAPTIIPAEEGDE